MDDFAAKRQALLESGVRMMDPDTVYVEAGVTVGAGTTAPRDHSAGEHGWWEQTGEIGPTPCSPTALWGMAL